ncbi:hypothetical protein OsJ_30324 [Oryza sativa Japonica Group]|uniref:Lipoprotein n=1 Tax=Oryza sativa subsp. japonica TaxID=39947 RepID=B9G514_ORYSJ|nr:hypothetical protein OsJ_30324 [Oryza sativa Japonica Group]
MRLLLVAAAAALVAAGACFQAGGGRRPPPPPPPVELGASIVVLSPTTTTTTSGGGVNLQADAAVPETETKRPVPGVVGVAVDQETDYGYVDPPPDTNPRGGGGAPIPHG